jgi:methyltransferase (TIGR00027 family)
LRKQKPSATACLIAASLGFCSRDSKLTELVNPLAARAGDWFMEAYGRPATFFIAALRQSWFKPVVYAVERSTIPGILLHYLLRKRYLEETAHRLLDQGIRQVVILGAGFDMLAVHLHPHFPDVTFLEVDYPATQAAKRKALQSKGLLKDNLVFLPVDFMRQTLTENLSKHPRYKSDMDTLFIAEGVLMYLSQTDVSRLFDFIRDNAGAGSHFAFTFMEPLYNGKVNFHNRSKIVDLWMQIRGEPFTWGILRENLPQYLSSVGFAQEALATPDVFRKSYLAASALTQEPLAEGEYVCVAKRAAR